ncbi:PREDICTED: uncharacterized protein LOC108366438 [Rhagoletis zephyria]|uniref:uncharacterized protein LOC108366438 n=1 Tax=Rhagoletis zephyria TaxID=28612 RepID=UPI0008115165|nr:PREDICTED: uncharacterized protein LOC108366438 [Rhagoletis zephyria]
MNERHHLPQYRDKQTPLETIGVRMISQVAIDSMHLIDLGVMRKFLLRVLQDKVNMKVSNENKNYISNSLKSLEMCITKEFVRKPRGFDEIYNWKATEFRQFLLYTGLSVLKNRVDDNIYYEYLLLHCSCRLLLCPKSYTSNTQIAQNMLSLFVQNFPVVFGETSVTYNVHHLLHLTNSIEEIGLISESSVYDFENYLQILKRYVKKPTHILQQLYKRISYESFNTETAFDGLKLAKNGEYKYFRNNCVSTAKHPDNYCLIKPYVPIEIQRFTYDNGGSVVGKKYTNVRSFFSEPVDSITLGISSVDLNLPDEEVLFPVSEIECKLLGLPHVGRLLFLPILHDCRYIKYKS